MCVYGGKGGCCCANDLMTLLTRRPVIVEGFLSML